MSSQPALLIVDDDLQVARSLERSFSPAYEVFTATSGPAALELLHQKNIGVILTDQRMPEMSGVQLLQIARGVFPNVIGMLISGYADTAVLIEALNSGLVHGFIPKPWNEADLQQKIRAAFTHHAALLRDQEELRQAAEALRQAETRVLELRQALNDMMNAAAGPGENEGSLSQSQLEHEFNHLDQIGSQPSIQVSAQIYGSQPLRDAAPEVVGRLAKQFHALLEQAVEQRIFKVTFSFSSSLRMIATEIGFLRAGPRDVIDLYNAVIRNAVQNQPPAKAKLYLEEGHVLCLELMGHLVSFYRNANFRK